MKPVLKAFLFFLLPIIILMGMGTVLFIGVGTLLARWLPLSLFQASGLAIGATLAVAAVIHVISAIMRFQNDFDIDDNVEDEQDYFDPIDTFPSEPDFSKVEKNDYCPCGSGRKFKNCCEKTIVK